MKRLFTLLAVCFAAMTMLFAADDVIHYGIWIGADGESQELTSANVGRPDKTGSYTDLTTLPAFKPYIKSGKVGYGYKRGVSRYSESNYRKLLNQCYASETADIVVLTLDNATIESAAGAPALMTEPVNKSMKLYIELKGNNYIKSSATAVMFITGLDVTSDSEIHFIGDGTLTIESDYDGISIDQYYKLYFENTTVKFKTYGDSDNACIKSDGNDNTRLTFYYSNIELDGGNGEAITGLNGISMKWNNFANDVAYNTDEKAICQKGTTTHVSRAIIQKSKETYGIKVNGIELDEDNINNFNAFGFQGKIWKTAEKRYCI